MKLLKTILITSTILISIQNAFSQEISADTTLANEYYTIANNLKKQYWNDSALFYVEKAQALYLNYFDENSLKNAKCLNLMGSIYKNKEDLKSALEYYIKSLNIYESILGEKSSKVANSYNNIGIVYSHKPDFEKALDYHFKSLDIRLSLFSENSLEVAQSYFNIGLLYLEKAEYNKALEYFFKNLEINREILGEKHELVVESYNYIGITYTSNHEYEKALENFFKGLEISIDLYGENDLTVAYAYNNIGIVYKSKKEYDKALEYYFKSFDIKEIHDIKNKDLANTFNNIGVAYNYKKEYDKALEYFYKSLKIYKEENGQEQKGILAVNINIGSVYSNSKKYSLALEYYQKAIACCLLNYNDTSNFKLCPEINEYQKWSELLIALKTKAELFADTTNTILGVEPIERFELALKHYQACDTLISKVRKEITTQSDKMALGEKASKVYQGAVDVCFQLMDCTEDPRSYREQAFYFSERNKSSVLLEALAGSDALKFAGIPQELLDRESTLSIDIARYTTLKNNAENDSAADEFENRLFNLKRTYDSLIVKFETEYPDYYNLKYNNIPVKIEQIQAMLDKKTTLLSYFVLDSSIVIYAITKKGYEVFKASKMNNFDDEIENFYHAIQSNQKSSVLSYKSLAYKLYTQLFPERLQSLLKTTKTKSLIIIPDGVLSTIPFEALLTEEYTKEFASWTDQTYFSEMPYLIKKYALSYCYSATLFYTTFPKVDSQDVEFKTINDFIAFAPVFDDKHTAGTTHMTRKLLSDLDMNFTDSSITKRAFLHDGTYISPLPGTLTEVERIFELFNENGYTGLIKTYKQANEDFIKSDELSQYRFIHFATHGFVNIEKPELSGILLAQDTSSTFERHENLYGNVVQQNDGILFQSEIYNLKLHSDLVVLSACETGLGKITSGEGVIGLTRALLYAGTKNIIVSLWSVSDASTSQLMIYFYDNLLKRKRQNAFSEELQKAKLTLIKEGSFAHPFYWSPFILIGK
jgi:CHAT domain-containing protein/Tfp pilus assembly protein PilF